MFMYHKITNSQLPTGRQKFDFQRDSVIASVFNRFFLAQRRFRTHSRAFGELFGRMTTAQKPSGKIHSNFISTVYRSIIIIIYESLSEVIRTHYCGK